jgi:2-polyprenyl-3-methyl-5-hydroxy-6-metoxy-1,4-benzoquinol methylase
MQHNKQHICPWWVGIALASPLRKLIHNPVSILQSHIKPGMKVLDYGCAMGFFTLPMARLTGETGDVYAVDIQKRMIDTLYRKAEKAGLEDNIHPILITGEADFEQLTGKIDFTLLFAMVHEVPDKKGLFKNISMMCKTGAKVLFAEPRGHVSIEEFKHSLKLAGEAGLHVISDLRIRGSHAVILGK